MQHSVKFALLNSVAFTMPLHYVLVLWCNKNKGPYLHSSKVVDLT